MSSQSQNQSNKNCYLCKTSDDDKYNLGGLKRLKQIKAHYFCLLLSETIKQSGKDDQGMMGFMPFDIRKEANQSRLKVCCYCNKYQATLGCTFKGCKRKYHLPCGLANKIQANFEGFTSLCHVHKKPSNVPKNIQKNIAAHSCMVCLENFKQNVDVNDIIGAECCQVNALMHIDCLKRLSVSAGYFTKCPCCNNTDQFIPLIKSYGVFVPEQDASWELPRNAFSDLYKVNKICSIKPCICPKGPKCNGSRNWKIVMCHYCGSFGSHIGCSTFNIDYICESCSISTIQDTTNNESISPSSSFAREEVPTNMSEITIMEISNEQENITVAENLRDNQKRLRVVFKRKRKRGCKKQLKKVPKRITRRSGENSRLSESITSSENVCYGGNNQEATLSIVFKKRQRRRKNKLLKGTPKRTTRSANDVSILEIFNGRYKNSMELRSGKRSVLCEINSKSYQHRRTLS